MSEKDDQHKKGYEAFVEELHRQWQAAENTTIKELVEKTQAYMEAAGDLTKDELALIAEYVKRDLAEVGHSGDEFRDSVFYRRISETVWGWLAGATDKSQLEWREFVQDLEHNGEYRAGEVVGPGQYDCTLCAHVHEITHPEVLTTCLECGHDSFIRRPLMP
ncbi:zinc ribbon-containing protein [Zobellella iuensis]|uniref:Zinc ribbon-containing protein n=1 Tax=Zobellella iuensis TaxID=2803811 RepID=A0ABS1QX87_9GAMM|nr:hypothetical protein [Zobellella iuensis]MBL1378738.1 hypothetical protein [Zobellella iuensis]